jgi:tetratricopeptide (TPR) repeat protein
MRGRFSRWLIPALVVGIAAGPAIAASGSLPGKWVEVRSAHFVVLGNAGERSERDVAANFERIREVFLKVFKKAAEHAAEPPFHVYVARDERTLRLLAPSLIKARGERTVAGRFVDSPAYPFALVLANLDPDSTASIVHHEYFHHLINQVGEHVPLWLGEGLSDFWSSVRFEKDATVIGSPLPGRLRTLEQPNWIPFDKLFDATSFSPDYRDRDRVGIFYAESWALLHYLTVGEGPRRGTAQYEDYLRLMASGRTSLEAAKEAFGDLAKLQHEVSTYARSGRYLARRTEPVPLPPPESLKARTVPDAEASAFVAMAILHSDLSRYAEPLVAGAIEAAPALAVTHTAAGLLALSEKRHVDAQREFLEATRAADPGPIPFYGLAVVQLAGDPPADQLGPIEQLLLHALDLDSAFAPAYSRLAALYLRRSGEERRAVAMIRRAEALQPGDENLALEEARVLDRAGDHAAALSRLASLTAPALASGDGIFLNNLCWEITLAGFATQALPLCERAVAQDPKDYSWRDSRGVARAATGDLAGAREDFAAVVSDPIASRDAEFIALRQSWLETLRRDENPITPDVLRELRESLSYFTFWGH